MSWPTKVCSPSSDMYNAYVTMYIGAYNMTVGCMAEVSNWDMWLNMLVKQPLLENLICIADKLSKIFFLVHSYPHHKNTIHLLGKRKKLCASNFHYYSVDQIKCSEVQEGGK